VGEIFKETKFWSCLKILIQIGFLKMSLALHTRKKTGKVRFVGKFETGILQQLRSSCKSPVLKFNFGMFKSIFFLDFFVNSKIDLLRRRDFSKFQSKIFV